MRGITRRTSGLAALGAALGAISVATALPASAAGAGSARVVNGSDNAHLHYVRSDGATLYEEGRATGALPGTLRASLKVGATFSGSVVLFTANGQLRATGSASPHGSGRFQTFAGTLTVTGGTGRYVHAHGSGRLYGEFDRRTFKLTIQTRGSFYY